MIHTVTIPALRTERLTLRAPQAKEFEPYRAMMTGPRGQFIDEYDDRTAWREFACDVGHWALFGYGGWHVERVEDGAVVGGVAVLNQDFYPEVELGWHLYDGFEGRGYATEAARAARDWAFAEHGLTTLVSYIDADNRASIAVAERLGAVLDPNAEKVDPEDVVYRHSPRVVQ